MVSEPGLILKKYEKQLYTHFSLETHHPRKAVVSLMATTTGASTELIPTQQIIVHQDNYAFPTEIILDETNYSLWSQLMEMRIGALNKAGYLTGETKKPEYGDPNHGA